MHSFEKYNPIVSALYFVSVSGIAMFCMNPVILGLSLFGAVLLFLMRNGARGASSHFFFLGFFLLMAVINPIFSHNGATVLFVINDSPITLEAVIYGFIASGTVTAVLYWFRSFTQIMTSDRLLYIFGRFSPKTALIFSMGLRYVPLFCRQAKKINQAQTALGLYKEDNIIDSARGGMRVFSVMLTWALENGIVTSDSMTARGYGIGKRTHFSEFTFRRSDAFLLFATLLLTLSVCVSAALGGLDFFCYPEIRFGEITWLTYIGTAAYAVLIFIPIIIETEERLRWKYLISKI